MDNDEKKSRYVDYEKSGDKMRRLEKENADLWETNKVLENDISWQRKSGNLPFFSDRKAFGEFLETLNEQGVLEYITPNLTIKLSGRGSMKQLQKLQESYGTVPVPDAKTDPDGIPIPPEERQNVKRRAITNEDILANAYVGLEERVR